MRSLVTVHDLNVSGLFYESLYAPDSTSKSGSLLGCPVISPVVCALAKSSGKTVVIREQKILSNGLGVEVIFIFVTGAA